MQTMIHCDDYRDKNGLEWPNFRYRDGVVANVFCPINLSDTLWSGFESGREHTTLFNRS